MQKKALFFNLARLTLWILCILVLSSCVTKKKKGDVGWLGKLYHNTTAKYNGYFNADVLVDESILSLETQHQNNYNQLLPLYPVIEVDNPKSVAADLDIAIEKVITVATLHEPSHWVDDCYVMMAKAQYLKQDFESAEETLEYFEKEFNPADPKSRFYNKDANKKSASEERREESETSRKLREAERKRAAKLKEGKKAISNESREAERSKRLDLRKVKTERSALSKKQKEEQRKFNEKKSQLRKKHQKELNELKAKHRAAASERRKEELKRQKEEREKQIEARRKAARTNTRSQRRKKTEDKPSKEQQTQQATTPQLTAEERIKQQEQQEIQALEQKHANALKAQEGEQSQLQAKWDQQIKALDTNEKSISDNWDKKINDLNNQEEVLVSEAEKADKEREEVEKSEENYTAEKNKKAAINKGEGGGLFKHKPAYSDGVLLLAKTYVERANWSRAEYLLNKLSESSISKEVAREIPVVFAHSYIRQKYYDKAMPYLKQGIDLAGDKKNKARYAYVAAQLYQMQNNNALATQYFELASDYSRDYEMAFNSKLSLLRNSWLSNSSTKESSMRALEKLMDDGKNLEYQDQILFTMAEIELASGNDIQAFDYFKQASAASAGNNMQKTEIMYKLASIYYEMADYRNAKSYYDSTSMVMNETDERYAEVNRKKLVLDGIARNLETIEMEDSLAQLAELPEEELLDWAKEQLEKSAAQATSEEDIASMEPNEPLTNRRNFSKSSIPSNFFAYNPLTKQKGMLDFKRKWGNRKLEDNWRRQDKQGSIIEDNIEDEIAEEAPTADDALLEEILSQVPRTEAQKQSSAKRLSGALFELGILYRSRLEEFTKSSETLEDLLIRFPENENKLEAYYYLHLDYLDLNNPLKAEQYLNKIVSEYPDSEYAAILTDPDYLDKKKEEQNQLESYFENTYTAFTTGDYATADKLISDSKEIFGDKNSHIIKFDLLEAMIQGSKQGKEVYIQELNDFIIKYPNTAEETRAKEIMRFLRGDEEAFGSRLYDEAIEEFNTEDDKLHYVIMVAYNADEKMVNNAKIKLSKYNSTYHKLDKLKITNIYLNPENKSQIILIRRFKNKAASMDYFDGTKKNAANFITQSELSHEIFTVTQRNYREIMKQRSIKNYRTFFENTYLR